MKHKLILMTTWLLGLSWYASTAIALTLPAVPMEPIYFEPPVIKATDDLVQLSCVDLDNNIRHL